MGTTTSRIALYKPLDDGSENVNVSTDLNQNYDKVDAAVGFQAVTSSTRPSSPYSGKPIMETDTSYRTYFSNGTSPASASWVEIPNSSASYNNNLNLASGKQINIGGSGSTAPFAAVLAAASNNALSLRVSGDTASRFFQNADGGMNWGPGGASSTDTAFARTGTGALGITGSLTISGTATAQVETTTSGATPSTDFTVTSFSARRTCGIATIAVTVTYSGATITGSSAGNITDTACVTLPSGWRPAFEIPVSYDKGGTAQGSVSIATSGLCTLKTLDATATIASGNALTFSATYVL